MGLWQRALEFLALEPRAQRAVIERRQYGANVASWQIDRAQWLPRDPATYDTEGYRKAALIFRCVQYLANAAGAAPLRVYRDTGTGEPTEERTHPARQLLERPNPAMGETRFLSFVAMCMAVSGFAAIEKVRSASGRVVELWPLRSDWMRPIPRNQAPPDWEYKVPGRVPERFDADDVIVLPFADTPDGSPIGIGPLEVLLKEVGITTALSEFLKVFFDRGAMPLYVAIPSDDPSVAAQFTDPDARAAFEEAWSQRYGGLSRSITPLPLVGFKDIRPLGFNFNDLAFPDLHNLTDARICAGFGIPPILVGANVGLEQATYSNYGQARRSFYEDSMTFLWARIDDAFTRHLLPEFETRPGYSLAFDITGLPAFEEDESPRWTRATEAFKASLISRHAAQREIGLEPHGPDAFLMPVASVELPTTARASIVDASYAALSASNGHHRGKHLGTTETRARGATTGRQAIAGVADRFAPHLRQFFRDQGDRIADQAARSGGIDHETRALQDVDWDEETERLRLVLNRLYLLAGQTAFAGILDSYGIDAGISFDLANSDVRNIVDQLGRRIVDITETTRTDVAAKIAAGLDDGLSTDEIADSLRGMFNETYRNRAENISRTESMLAYGHASVLGYRTSGVVSKIQCFDNEAHTEPYHGAEDGLTCAKRDKLIAPLDDAELHLRSEHPRGSLVLAPVLTGED